MEPCPRCGATVLATQSQCPRCGLARVVPPAAPYPTQQYGVPPGPPPQYSAVPPGPPRRRRALWAVLGTAAVLLVAVAVIAALRIFGAGDDAAETSPGVPVVTVTQTPAVPQSGDPRPSTAPTEATGDFADIYAAVQSRVALVRVDTCDKSYAGTAFLVDDHTLVTAAHVIDGGTEITVDFGEGALPAELGGVLASSDLALLTLASPVSNHHFDIEAATDPTPGTQVAVIGFPLSEPKSLTVGTISGLDRRITTESGTYEGLLQTDAAINPGNSGGPLLNADGDVVGVADAIRADAQGIGFAVPVSSVRSVVQSDETLASPMPPACTTVTEPTTDSVQEGVSDTLETYLGAITASDYDLAMRQLSARMRAKTTVSQWYNDYATTYDDLLQIRSVGGTADRPRVWATFRSQQDPGFGPAGAEDATCLLWSVDYEMVRRGNRWIISGAGGHGDPPWTRCD